MKEVMMCAQKLAEAILNSDVYQHMHTLEEQVTQDEDATKAIAAYMEKRTAVEQAMRKPDIDPSQLAEAAQELEDVQQAMNDCPIIRDMRDAQKKYQDMMDNLRLHRQLRLLQRLPLIWESKIIHEIMPLWVRNQASQPKSSSRPQETLMAGGVQRGLKSRLAPSSAPSGRSLVPFWRARKEQLRVRRSDGSSERNQ